MEVNIKTENVEQTFLGIVQITDIISTTQNRTKVTSKHFHDIKRS